MGVFQTPALRISQAGHPQGGFPGFFRPDGPCDAKHRQSRREPHSGLLLWFSLFRLVLCGRRPRRVVPACCRANSSFLARQASKTTGGRAADFTLEPGGLSVRENLLRLACGAVELWGLNDSLSSSPLRPRRPLLFGIIQKVGKKIIQGGLTSPLEIPRPTFKYDLNRISRPAPGDRAYDDGALREIGRGGYIWSSAIPTESDNARYLGFSYNGLRTQDNSFRAHGLQLRCLQE